MKKIFIASLLAFTIFINSYGHTVSILSSTNITCNGLCNGTATALASGGTGPYTYVWSNGQVTATATNLCPGTYTVTATDDGDMSTAVVSVTIVQPSQLMVSTTPVYPNGGNCNGSITAVASGGTAPYLYYWNNGITLPLEMGLCAGQYCITVTDAIGCTVTTCVTLTAVTITSVATTPTTCGLCNGTAIPNFTGGNPPYSFMWSNGMAASTAYGLCAGNYGLTITDSNGSWDSLSFTIGGSSGLSIVLDTIINANCANNTPGSITIHATGGTGIYTYLWSPNGEVTPSISNLTGGYYTVFATESGGCSDSIQFYVGNSSNMYASINNTLANCGNNGTAQLTVQGDNPPFTYLWSDTQTTSTAINLAQGSYIVTITDNTGCSIIASTSIQYNCSNLIKGRIYFDLNQNCIQDVGETGLPGVLVFSSPGNYWGYTDSIGDYHIYTPEMNNSVSVNNNNMLGYTPTCPNPATLTVNFSQIGDTLLNNDFGFWVNPSIIDLGIHPGWTTGHPGFDKHYWILYYNSSPAPQNALIRFTYDPALQYLYCTQGGINYPLEHKVEWTFNNIPHSNGWSWSNAPYIYFNVPTTVTNTDTLCSSFEILPIIGDAQPWDNTLNICEHVTGSHDPNSKDVIPRGQGN